MSGYAEKLRGLRAEKRLTQARFAKAVGISLQTVIDIESKRIGLDNATFVRFVKILACNDNDRKSSERLKIANRVKYKS
jgi:DNA-binding XRE family transcriptional regulator